MFLGGKKKPFKVDFFFSMRNRNISRLSSQTKISQKSDILENEYQNYYFQIVILNFSSILCMGYHPNNQLSLIKWLPLKYYVVTYTNLEKWIKTNSIAMYHSPRHLPSDSIKM